MRTLILAAVLCLAAPTAAFASCPALPDDRSTHYVENKTALTLCRQYELTSATRRQQLQLDLQTALQAQQSNFEIQLRMQQNFTAARAAAQPDF